MPDRRCRNPKEAANLALLELASSKKELDFKHVSFSKLRPRTVAAEDAPPFALHVSLVLGGRPEKEMIRVYTETYVAVMTDK